MPYTRSTVSSRRRARTPTVEPEAVGHRGGSSPPSTPTTADGATAKRAKSDASPSRRMRSRMASGAHHQARAARKESRTVHAKDEEELRLSQELTSECDAVIRRVHALLDRTQQQEAQLNRALEEALRRSPPRQPSASPQRAGGSVSPQLTSAAKTPRRSSSRWSGMFGTPHVPKAPPPTPVRPESVSWLGKLFGRSPEGRTPPTATSPTPALKKSDSPPNAESLRASPWKEKGPFSPALQHASAEDNPSLFQRAIQRLSGRLSLTSPQAESPRCSRKSVVFKELGDELTVTPSRPTKKQEELREDSEQRPSRGSLLYPPAPPPSLQKEATRCSSSRSPSSPSTARHVDVRPDMPDVSAIIRNFSHSRAFKQLTKADLVDYAKLHHVTLAVTSTKKELFEVVQRLVKCKLEEAK